MSTSCRVVQGRTIRVFIEMVEWGERSEGGRG